MKNSSRAPRTPFPEIGEKCALSEEFVRKLGKTGRLQIVRIGRAVRIPRRAVLQLCRVECNNEGDLNPEKGV